MSRTISPSSEKPYGVALVARVWELSRSTYYGALHRQAHPRVSRKRGPQRISDEALLGEIRQVIDTAVFTGEGYRKVWARLRHKGLRVWKERVLRLMREHHLLSPHRQASVTPEYPHEGIIVTERPNQVWGTDATATLTDLDGQVTVFAAIKSTGSRR
jgi:hypothetical protein